MLILSGFSFYKYRTARLKKQKKRLEKNCEATHPGSDTGQSKPSGKERRDRDPKVLSAKQSEQLKKLDKAKSNFFTNISHEFRTPLTLILGPIHNILKARCTDPKKIAHQLTLAERNASRLLYLTNQILELAAIESGKIPLVVSLQDLIASIQEIAEPFKLLAEDKNIHFEIICNQESGLGFYEQDKLEKFSAICWPMPLSLHPAPAMCAW
ncbi:MAG: hypothetical protein HC880_04720 [Bacteroidia bacterium]|nr:hypothetical protein [Bacteroidia bacterium]